MPVNSKKLRLLTEQLITDELEKRIEREKQKAGAVDICALWHELRLQPHTIQELFNKIWRDYQLEYVVERREFRAFELAIVEAINNQFENDETYLCFEWQEELPQLQKLREIAEKLLTEELKQHARQTLSTVDRNDHWGEICRTSGRNFELAQRVIDIYLTSAFETTMSPKDLSSLSAKINFIIKHLLKDKEFFFSIIKEI